MIGLVSGEHHEPACHMHAQGRTVFIWSSCPSCICHVEAQGWLCLTLSLSQTLRMARLHYRDYEAIAQDFVTLQFMDKGTDLRPIMPVLAKVR